jgi:type II secretory pathway pseudopilin PulG
MKIKSQQSTESASTLAEVLAAVTVLAICAAGLMGALANGFRTVQFARENQRATQILMEETEMIRLYTWDQVNKPGFIPTSFIAAYDPQSANGGGLNYTGAVAITSAPFSASYATNIKQLTLTLNWSSKKVARTRTVTTLVSKDGLQNYVY